MQYFALPVIQLLWEHQFLFFSEIALSTISYRLIILSFVNMGNSSWKHLLDVIPHLFLYEPRTLAVVHQKAAFMLACLIRNVVSRIIDD